ncbi:MAG: cytochrome c [Kofleriaceae bacterium]|nr:cytochrome c [Kofleriaceae bacterium]
MKMVKHSLVILSLVACGGRSPTPARPEPVPPPAVSSTEAPAASPANDVVAQAALAEQYDLGKRLYIEKKCASCHEANGQGNPKNPAVIGDGALPEAAPTSAKLRATVSFRTAGDVLVFVKAKMPLKEPGTLTDDEAAAVTAWMLSESKVAISTPLNAASASAIPLRP